MPQNIYDIVEDYYWTQTPPPGKRGELGVPYVDLRPKQMEQSSLLSGGQYYLNALTRAGQEGIAQGTTAATSNNRMGQWDQISDLYASMYPAEPTGVTYRIPYFDKFDHNVVSDYGENRVDVPVAGIDLAKFVQKASLIAGATYAAYGYEIPKMWTGQSKQTYGFQFDLLNSINKDAILRNIEFKNQIITDNLHSRQGAIQLLPPVIYEVRIPGIRFCPAAKLNVQVQSLGTSRIVTGLDTASSGSSTGQQNAQGAPIKTPIQVPDAYRFIIQIEELVAENREMYNGFLEQGEKITVGGGT